MGKGDKKTKRGKIVIGSYGVRRRRKASVALPKKVAKVVEVPEEVTEVTEVAEVKPAVEKKAKAPKKAATTKKKKEETAE